MLLPANPAFAAGLDGLRRQRAAPSLLAILRKSGSVAEKAYPEIAITAAPSERDGETS